MKQEQRALASGPLTDKTLTGIAVPSSKRTNVGAKRWLQLVFYISIFLSSISVKGQLWVSGNAYLNSLPVISHCPDTDIPVHAIGNPTGVVNSSQLAFSFNDIHTTATNYRIQINKGVPNRPWNNVNGYGADGNQFSKLSTLYEFVGTLNNQSSFSRNISIQDLDGPGTYYVTVRQYIPGPVTVPSGLCYVSYGESAYSTPVSFTLESSNLEIGTSHLSCSVNSTNVNASVSVKNNGIFGLGGFLVGFYLSLDPYLDPNDIRFDEVTVGYLGAGASTGALNGSANVASIASPGTYNIIVKVDYGLSATESNETDNDHRYSGCQVIVPVSQLDAGIANPAEGLMINRYNHSTYIDSDGKLLVDGWSNTNPLAWIRLFLNGYDKGTVQNPNNSAWNKAIDVSAGTNSLYATVRCNYNGCSINGLNTPTRAFTYMQPLTPWGIWKDDAAGTIEIKWSKHTTAGTAGFHYQVYRNTIDSPGVGSDWVMLGTWTQNDQYFDTPPLQGVTYYYWVACAASNTGLHPSAYGGSRNATLTLPDPVILSATSTGETLNENDGTISTTTSGGQTPYTYAWSNGASSSSIANLSDGSYSLTVTDAVGTTATASAVVDPYGLTRLINPHCGITLTSLSNYLQYTMVPGATAYGYRFTGPSGNNLFYQRNFAASNFQVAQVQGIAYNTTYSVEVMAYYNGHWGSYGTACSITTPAGTPATYLKPISCGATIALWSEYLYYKGVPGANAYELEFTNPNTGLTISRTLTTTNILFLLGWVQNIQSATLYNVRVRARVGGVWGSFGMSCTVTTPSSPVLRLALLEEELAGGKITFAEDWKIFPNPANGAFFLQYQGFEVAPNVALEVYDLSGRLVSKRSFSAAELGSPISVTTELSSGTYLVVVKGQKLLYQQRLVVL